MKTEVTALTLVDILVVGKALPQDEIEQIEAFSGESYDVQTNALRLMNASGPKWTVRVKETGEPLVVAGIVQIGSNIWRTWFLANQRAWDKYGREVSFHTAKMRKQLLKGQQHIRIETLCLASRSKAREWYKAVGMKYESTLTCYGVNGESAVMYVSIQGARKD